MDKDKIPGDIENWIDKNARYLTPSADHARGYEMGATDMYRTHTAPQMAALQSQLAEAVKEVGQYKEEYDLLLKERDEIRLVSHNRAKELQSLREAKGIAKENHDNMPENIAYWLRVEAGMQWIKKGSYSANEHNAFVEGAEAMYYHTHEITPDQSLREENQKLKEELAKYVDGANTLLKVSDIIIALRTERDECVELLRQLGLSFQLGPVWKRSINRLLDKYKP